MGADYRNAQNPDIKVRMSRQETLISRKRGPAPRGATGLMVRVEPGLLRALDEWIRAHDPQASRPGAIRKIVARVLGVDEAGP